MLMRTTQYSNCWCSSASILAVPSNPKGIELKIRMFGVNESADP